MNTINIGMVGHNFMGKAHSHAWRTAPRFFDLPLTPRMTALAGRDAGRVGAAAATLGWESTETDWRRLIEREDVDLVDICVPGDLHAEIATAALEAGKHVLCEKPLANTVAEAERMVAAAEAAQARGVFAMCGFSYRRTPALTLAKRLVDSGALGPIRHVRAQYLQDWLTDENTPLTWRLDKDKSGSGSLGDIGAHIIDAAQWIAGSDLTGVSALLTTFVADRPIGGDFVGLGGTGGTDGPRGPVTVDDAAMFTARFADGAVGVFEATRFALGRKNAMRLELNGSKASLAFDFEDMNALWFYDAADEPNAGFRRIQATEPEHPYTGNWWPVGHGLGYEHAFTHQAVDFIEAIAQGQAPSPSFAEALQVQRVLEAVATSAADESRWTAI
nr:Gfo/Idh/MocA family oxidoreductase [Glycomyces sp. NRRL B-16210]